jgi:hypothetical protein
MQFPLPAQTLNRKHLFAVGFGSKNQARIHRLPIEKHRAGPAVSLAAALLGTRQTGIIPNELNQGLADGHVIEDMNLAVDPECNASLFQEMFLPS